MRSNVTDLSFKWNTKCSTGTGTAQLSLEVQFGSKGAGCAANWLDDLSSPYCLGQKAVKRLLWAGFCRETIYFCRVSAVVSVLLFLLKMVSKGLHCCRGYSLSAGWRGIMDQRTDWRPWWWTLWQLQVQEPSTGSERRLQHRLQAGGRTATLQRRQFKCARIK